MSMDFTVSNMYGGMAGNTTPSYVATPTQTMATGDIAAGVRGLVDPRNPLTWLGVVLLITVGAAGVAGSVRLGKAKAGVSIGST